MQGSQPDAASPPPAEAELTPLTRFDLQEMLEKAKDDDFLELANLSELKETFCAAFKSLTNAHVCSGKAQDKIIEFIDDNFALISAIKDRNGRLPCIRTVIDTAHKAANMPEVMSNFRWHGRMDPGIMEEQRNQKTYKKMGDEWVLEYECASVGTADLVEFHAAVCPRGYPKTCIVSIDGVSENNTSGTTVDIVSVVFDDCRCVYPCTMSRPMEGSKRDSNADMAFKTAQELQELDVKVMFILADTPCASKLMCQAGHNGYHSCRYCWRKGDGKSGEKSLPAADTGDTDGTRPAATESSKKHPVYPYTDQVYGLRTMGAIIKILEGMAEKKVKVGEDAACGYYSRTPLIDLDGFDVTRQIPGEMMHNVYQGLYKRTLQLIFKFKVGGSCYKGALKHRHSTIAVNSRLRRLKVPSEFGRRYV